MATVKALPASNGSKPVEQQTGKQSTPAAATSNTPSKPEKATPQPVALAPKSADPNELDDLKPIEDRVHKVQELYSIVEKLETLRDTRQKLKAFKLSSDGNSDSLQIRDSKGNAFNTTNSAAIAKVVEVLKVEIDAKISETENRIRL